MPKPPLRPRCRAVPMVLVALAVVILAGPRTIRAQSVTVPTFTVHAADVDRTTLSVDLVQGADGSIMFAWDERRTAPLAGFAGTDYEDAKDIDKLMLRCLPAE